MALSYDEKAPRLESQGCELQGQGFWMLFENLHPGYSRS